MEKEPIKKFKLNPVDGQKSFYGKAVVEEYSDGLKRLISYDTIVAEIDVDGNFRKIWNGFSTTTMKHINAFIEHYGIEGGGKKWWMSLEPYEKTCGESYVVVQSTGFYTRKFRVIFDNSEDAERFAEKLHKQRPMTLAWVEEIEKAG